ncbi:MAG: hypothetical protein GY875_25820 [Gammaproteobacteria bacterium]|nr:hypothetical protein [Gammaproteobacteria bacterium]
MGKYKISGRLYRTILTGIAALGITLTLGLNGASAADPIVRDAEFYILQAQHGEQWAADDQEFDAQLAAFRAHNGGKPPNIFYILIDDIGFGDLGRPSKSIFQRRQHARNRPW